MSVAITASAAAAGIHGAWTANSESPTRVHLFMTTNQSHQWGQSFDLASLGWSPSLLEATTATPVNLTIRRDAGTFSLEGTFKNGDGAGQFTFAPNRAYLEALRATGVTFDLAGDRSESDELLSLAIVDLSLDYVRTMHTAFPEATLRDIRRARGSDVTLDYIASIRRAGLEVAGLHDASRLASNEVTPEYVAALRSAGVEIRDTRDAMRLKANDVTPEYVAELAAAGYKNLSAHDLVRMKAAGVDARYIRDMAKFKDKSKQ